MKVKLTYFLWSDCWWEHTSIVLPAHKKKDFLPSDIAGSAVGGAILSHDAAKNYLGTPCAPGYMALFQIVDETEVMEKLKIMKDLGHPVEVEYLPANWEEIEQKKREEWLNEPI